MGKILFSSQHSQVAHCQKSFYFAFRWWCQCSRGATAGKRPSWKAGGRLLSRYDNLKQTWSHHHLLTIITYLENFQGTESMTEEEVKLDLTEKMKEEDKESESVNDFHSCGIGRFRLNEETLVCVDGQQRLTTTSLLVAAARSKLISFQASSFNMFSCSGTS